MVQPIYLHMKLKVGNLKYDVISQQKYLFKIYKSNPYSPLIYVCFSIWSVVKGTWELFY